jgi:Zn-dependent protease with chaperone function
MSGVVARRMVLVLGGLVGLVLAVGVAAVVLLGAPPWLPAVTAILVVGLQYLVGPPLLRWLVPARVIPHDGRTYATDDPIGALVARRCGDAGVPLVRLGIIDDGTPNAFAFGRTPRSGHVWVSRGLIERLDEDELDAVVCHELGHVRHWDMAVMTVAALVPMMLYLVYVMSRLVRRAEAQAVALGAFVAYFVAQVLLLALSRAREIAADRWSVRCRGDEGAALSSALVKIAYGIGEVDAERRHRAAVLAENGGKPAKEDRLAERRADRIAATRVMGIASEADAKALTGVLDRPQDVGRALAALEWDRTSPWARLLEKLSTHPLVATRLALLGPAPQGVEAPRPVDSAPAGGGRRASRAYAVAGEALIAALPWAAVVAAFAAWRLDQSRVLAWAVVALGASYVVKQAVRYRPGRRVRVDAVADLLHRLDAGPVAGLPVEVRGRVTGRGTPGYVLSPDLVITDDSGFVPLVYTNPVPVGREWFGAAKVGRLLGRTVVARGWYFRGPGPWIELRDLDIVDPAPGGPASARGWDWIVRPVVGAVVLAVGIVMLAVVGVV